MASTVSAKKRIRQNATRRARNRWRLKSLREALKDLDDKIIHSSYDEAKASYDKAAQLLDKTASKGVIHKNTAARKKSRMNAKVKAMKK